MKNCFTALLIMTLFSSMARGHGNIEMVVPYGAGGASDLVARAMAPHLADRLDHNTLVVNRPGGNTKIGTNYVLKNKADGHTLMLISSWIFLNPAQYKDAGFKIEDFDFVSPFGYSPLVLAVKNDSGIRTWADFLNKVKTGNLNCGVHGEAPKLVANLLVKTLQTPNLQMINYRAYGDHMVALLSGQVDCGIATKQEFMKHHTNSDIRILAVSSPTQLKDLPNVKLLKDIHPGLSISAIYSVGLLASTPSDQKQKFFSAAKDIATHPPFLSRLSEMGIDIFAGNVDENGQRWAQEQYRAVDQIIQQSGIAKIE